MTLVRLCVLTVAATATIIFIVALKLCFRSDGASRREKPWMIASIYGWTVLEWWALLVMPEPAEWLQWLGIAVFTVAILLFLWSVGTLRAAHPALAFVEQPPERLVTNGPYARIRHPIYTSYVLAWIGGVLATGQWWLALAVVWMGWFYLRAARMEEARLKSSSLAEEFDRYAARAGMFVPSVR